MCGIFGIISDNPTIYKAINSLKKMEYRGYDSAGISFLKKEKITTIKEKGEIANLEKIVKKAQKTSSLSTVRITIGHTRWATHGKANKINSHPHCNTEFAVVHNGIVENHQIIKKRLIKNGVIFKSETDSEVIPHLIYFYFQKLKNYQKAIFAAIEELEGNFAIVVLHRENPNLLVVAKRGSPIVLGHGKNENFIASDFQALEEMTDKITFLEDNDIAFVNKENIEIFHKGKIVSRKSQINTKNKNKTSKNNFEHFMLKEIFDQPKTIQDSIEKYLDDKKNINLPIDIDLKKISKINIIACGTSYHAGMIAKYAIEKLTTINVEVDIASEFRYRDINLHKNDINIFISQSGETADSMAALKKAKKINGINISIVNNKNSSMDNMSDFTIKTTAGPEIGVASTKVYIAQITILLLLAIKAAIARDEISETEAKKLISSIISLPKSIDNSLANKKISHIKQIAKTIKNTKNILYIGRLISYVSALEGALKLKELSYINAFGIAAGELKHGTIALIDKETFTIALSPSYNAEIYEKTTSNIEEIQAREGKIILISDEIGLAKTKIPSQNTISLPPINNFIEEAILSIIPMQLLAYYVALSKGYNVDRPRNLAKSVTVE